MNAPEQVAITSLSFVVRPPTKEVPKGAAPRKLWLATADALFAVTFAEDPWAHAGTSYDVKFPAPLKTRCLAVVLDEAYVKGVAPDVNVDDRRGDGPHRVRRQDRSRGAGRRARRRKRAGAHGGGAALARR